MKKIFKLLFMMLSILVLGYALFNVTNNKENTITHQNTTSVDIINTQQSNALSLIKYNLYTLYLAGYYDVDNRKYEQYYVFE